jgi:hypothetical protein
MLKSLMLLSLSLILISSRSYSQTLNQNETVPVAIPDNLKPVPEVVKDVPVASVGSTDNFFCTDRKGAESIAVSFRENVDCHRQLSAVSSNTDWSMVVLVGAVALLSGFVIGEASH